MSWRQFKTNPPSAKGGRDTTLPPSPLKPLEPLKPAGETLPQNRSAHREAAFVEPLKPLEPAGENLHVASLNPNMAPQDKALKTLKSHEGNLYQLYCPEISLQGEKLRISGVVEDLAGAIAGLTENNLPLQRRLLEAHCQAYSPTHLWRLVEQWAKRAEAIEYEGGFSRQQAEEEAARQYHLLAWVGELRHFGIRGPCEGGGRKNTDKT